MNRHQLREKCMTCLYQNVLLSKSINEASVDVFGGEVNKLNVFEKNLLTNVMNNKEKYIEYINDVLHEWTFDRLGYVEKAILLMAAAELDFETAGKAIVIDEAVTLSKKYCDEETYKLINGVLDRL